VGSYEGHLQSDAYICYELIAAASEHHIIAVGCWAHARRKFEPLIVAGPHPKAAWILGEIQKLYDIEDRARDMTDDERLALVGMSVLLSFLSSTRPPGAAQLAVSKSFSVPWRWPFRLPPIGQSAASRSRRAVKRRTEELTMTKRRLKKVARTANLTNPPERLRKRPLLLSARLASSCSMRSACRRIRA
jgi:hypothetical protein